MADHIRVALSCPSPSQIEEPYAGITSVNDLSWDLNEIAFRVAAARQLLISSENHDDGDKEMLGVDYMLAAITRQLEALAQQVSNTRIQVPR